jgi:hypothetical protein
MIRRILPLSILSAALAICLVGVSSASAADEKGSVSGKVVTSAGDAVKNPTGNGTAKVYVLKPDDAVATQPANGQGRPRIDTAKAIASGDITDGAYKIADVPVGKYVIVAMVRSQGGGTGKADIEVTAGKDTATEIKLTPRQGGGGNRPNGGAASAPAAK